MQLCFDATRFGTGLEGAIELAAAKGVPAVEYSFAPFVAKSKKSLDVKEKKYLGFINELGKRLEISIACLNLDFCLLPGDKKANKDFLSMVGKLAQVANAVNCAKISIFLAPGDETHWLELAEKELQAASRVLQSHGVSLLIRLSTAPMFLGRSLKMWKAMEPQNWRDLMSIGPGIGLSFSAADCIWLGIDYLRILPGLVSGIEHIEANDVEIIRRLLQECGLFGPLWWRYRQPGKGQVDWTQLVEALKLYDFKGTFSIHLDDEFIAPDHQSLEEALDSSLQLLAPLVND